MTSPLTAAERTFLESHALERLTPSSRKDRLRVAHAVFMARTGQVSKLADPAYIAAFPEDANAVLAPLREYVEELKHEYAPLWDAICECQQREDKSLIFDCSFSQEELEAVRSLSGADISVIKTVIEEVCEHQVGYLDGDWWRYENGKFIYQPLNDFAKASPDELLLLLASDALYSPYRGRIIRKEKRIRPSDLNILRDDINSILVFRDSKVMSVARLLAPVPDSVLTSEEARLFDKLISQKENIYPETLCQIIREEAKELSQKYALDSASQYYALIKNDAALGRLTGHVKALFRDQEEEYPHVSEALMYESHRRIFITLPNGMPGFRLMSTEEYRHLNNTFSERAIAGILDKYFPTWLRWTPENIEGEYVFVPDLQPVTDIKELSPKGQFLNLVISSKKDIYKIEHDLYVFYLRKDTFLADIQSPIKIEREILAGRMPESTEFTPGKTACLEAINTGRINLRTIPSPLYDEMFIINKKIHDVICNGGKISLEELEADGNEYLKRDMLRVIDNKIGMQRQKYIELYAYLQDMAEKQPDENITDDSRFPVEHFADILPSDVSERLSEWNIDACERGYSPVILEQLHASGNDPDEAFACLISRFDENSVSMAEKLSGELRVLTALTSMKDYRERLYGEDSIFLTL